MLRLASLLAATLFVVGALLIGERYAEGVERRYVHALAPEQFHQKNQGSALQRAAFRQPDLLPLYGSSELQTLDDPYHASNLFREYPSGFTVSTVGNVGTTTLIMAQALAAVGSELRGRKVVVSLSPYWFYQLQDYAAEYAGSFSPLHAGAVLFDTSLSIGLRRDLARRMATYPAPLEGHRILKTAVRMLSNDTRSSRLGYYALLPLGHFQNWILRLQDHWESVSYIQQQPLESDTRRRAADLDWDSLKRRAEQDYKKHNDNNPLGFDNDWYQRRFQRSLTRNTLTDTTFQTGLQTSAEWTDLDLVLRVLKERGAQPLILCAPSPGLFYDLLGISEGPRRAFYQKLDSVVTAFGMPLVSFSDHDRDSSFSLDPAAHPSEKGWVYFDEAFDAHYHGRLK